MLHWCWLIQEGGRYRWLRYCEAVPEETSEVCLSRAIIILLIISIVNNNNNNNKPINNNNTVIVISKLTNNC